MALLKRARSPEANPTAGATAARPPPPAAASSSRRPSTNTVKRARREVKPDETTQVTCLDSFKLDLADADVLYFQFVATDLAERWYDELLKLSTWYHPKLKVYGRDVQQSRKIAGYASDPQLVVKYSGHLVELHQDYPPVLRQIQEQLEMHLGGVKFNHVMLNLYENGTVYIGNHRDNRENRVIASLSLGAPRMFVMTHDKAGKEGSDPRYKKRWPLESGSVLVMQGTTQQHWKHEIPKEPSVKEGRISLTFRQLVF